MASEYFLTICDENSAQYEKHLGQKAAVTETTTWNHKVYHLLHTPSRRIISCMPALGELWLQGEHHLAEHAAVARARTWNHKADHLLQTLSGRVVAEWGTLSSQ